MEEDGLEDPDGRAVVGRRRREEKVMEEEV